ncbi:MAG TPA: hypothetical protein PK431_09020 [Chitinophagales bacterium]|nr:hypothetical protein [Chitinophagales bacterium]
MVTTILPNYLYNGEDNTIELTEKEKSDKEVETDFKLKFVPFTQLNSTYYSTLVYTNLQATKFALFSHFPEDENHTSTIDFPPEIA